MVRPARLVPLALWTTCLLACQGAQPEGVRVTLDARRLVLGTSAQHVFLAEVDGATDQTVHWSVKEGATGGAIDSDGAYRAPPAEGTFHVVATSVEAPQQSAEAEVVVVAPPEITAFTASPDLLAAGTTTLLATFKGGVGAVDHGVGPVVSGTPVQVPVAASTLFVLTVTSAAGATTTSAVGVTVGQGPALLAVVPAVATVAQGATQAFSAVVGGPASGQVTWTVLEGADAGTVSDAGVYTPPAHGGTFHVVATRAPAVQAQATVMVPPAWQPPALAVAGSPSVVHVKLVTNAAGKAALLDYLVSVPGFPEYLVVRLFDGTGWTSRVVATAAQTASHDFLYRDLDLDAAGNVVVAWTQLTSTLLQNPYAARYLAASKTWSNGTLLDSSSNDCQGLAVAAGSSGEAAVAYVRRTTTPAYFLALSRSAAGAATWVGGDFLAVSATSHAGPSLASRNGALALTAGSVFYYGSAGVLGDYYWVDLGIPGAVAQAGRSVIDAAGDADHALAMRVPFPGPDGVYLAHSAHTFQQRAALLPGSAGFSVESLVADPAGLGLLTLQRLDGAEATLAASTRVAGVWSPVVGLAQAGAPLTVSSAAGPGTAMVISQTITPLSDLAWLRFDGAAWTAPVALPRRAAGTSQYSAAVAPWPGGFLAVWGEEMDTVSSIFR